MADPKEIIKKINDGSLTYEEQLALLSQVEQTIKEQKQKKDEQLQLKADYIVQAFNKIKTDLETRIAEIEGKEPIKGDKGEKGDKGDRGLDGYQGRDGKDGKDGEDGLDGQDGVGVADARIDFDGSLVITLTDGREIDAGEVFPFDTNEKLKVYFNNLSVSGSSLPDQTGNSGKFLTTNGTDASWATVSSGSGTVTSVAVSGGVTGLTTTGGPVTSSGTITLAGTLAISNGGTGQTTASAAFNAISPVTTTGDLIVGNGTNSSTRLGIGANGYVLTSNGTTVTWAAASGGGGGDTSSPIPKLQSWSIGAM